MDNKNEQTAKNQQSKLTLKIGKLVTNRELVLKTWSSTLLDKSNLPDDWINTSGVLVGMDLREQTQGDPE